MATNTKLSIWFGLLSLTGLAHAQTVINKVELAKSLNESIVKIGGTNLAMPKLTLGLSGTATILDFNAKLQAKAGRLSAEKNGLKYVQYGWFSSNPPRVRVVLRHASGAQPKVELIDGVLIAKFTSATATMLPKKPDEYSMENAIAMLAGTPPDAALVKPKTPSVSENNFPEIVPPIELASRLDQEPSPKKIKATVGNSGTMHAAPPPKKQETPKPEKFPETVPPIDPSHRAIATGSGVANGQVSLDFVNTDVMAILKALAIQTGVNIVAAPDVSPSDKPMKLTMSLSKVGVEEALNLLTAMAGLRYAKVGNTYIVTRSDNFATAMRHVVQGDATRYKTRVVSLKSGEGIVIKDSTLKAMPPDGLGGWYEIVVPAATAPAKDSGANRNAVNVGMDPTMMSLLQDMNSRLPQQPGSNGQPGTTQSPPKTEDQGQEMPQAGATRQKAFYLLLIGEERRLDAIQQYVEDLDQRIVVTFSNATAKDVSTVVVPIYSGQQDRIMSMMQRLLQNNPRADEFSLSSTSVKELPEFEMATTVLLMMGPSNDLQSLRQFATAIDDDMCKAAGIEIPKSIEDGQRFYEVVALNYIEPKLAEYDLKSRIRGLHVTVLPDVVTPNIKGESETEKQAGPEDATQGSTKKKEEQKKAIGSEPMKLMLRGTREQIRQAKEYLALIDIAPKQVAIEMRVMDLTKEDLLKAGIDWNLFTGGVVKILRLNNAQPTIPNPPSNIISGSIRGRDVTASLDEITTKTNLIARPNAMAMDGRQTELFVGDVIRYIQSIQSTQQGVTVTTGEVKVGVRLNITPRVGSNNSIVLDLQPTVSFLRGFTDVPGGGQLPQTSDRTVRSTISIATGETIAIGGLIQDQDTKELSGLPILKDLPILGWLFRKTTNTRKRTEVVIFLTAQVVDGVATGANVPKLTDPDKDSKKVKAGGKPNG